MKDVQLGSLRVTNFVVGGVVERVDYLKKNQAFHNLLSWTVSKSGAVAGSYNASIIICATLL